MQRTLVQKHKYENTAIRKPLLTAVRLWMSATWMTASMLATLATAQQEITLTQSFEPSINIEPLVARISGRQGDVVQFQFKVQTRKAEPAKIESKLVGLRQDINGQVLFDEKIVNSDVIQLLSPGQFTLVQDKPFIVEGLVRVPRGEANFHSFGVLVKDLGKERDRTSQFDADGKEKTSAGINFMTQYLLRVDLDVEGARGEHGRLLQLENATVTVRNGLPQLTAFVRNPSSTAFEFELRAQLQQHSTDRSFAPIRLVMPVRERVEGPERFVGRTLPESQVKMQGLIQEPLPTGDYVVELQLLVGGKPVHKKHFTVAVDASDFPAYQTLINHLGSGVYVTPSVVQLSQAKGGQRRVSLDFRNRSDGAKTIRLSAKKAGDSELTTINLQPEEFSLAPGKTRKLAVSLKSTRDYAEQLEYANIVVSVVDHQGVTETGSIPLALFYATPPTPDVELEQLRWVPGDKYPCFRLAVNNKGQVHLPLNARLIIIGESGTQTIVPGGFGKWLMPGKTEDLEFRLDSALPVGKYSITTELERGGQLIQQKGVYEISDYDSATAAR